MFFFQGKWAEENQSNVIARLVPQDTYSGKWYACQKLLSTACFSPASFSFWMSLISLNKYFEMLLFIWPSMCPLFPLISSVFSFFLSKKESFPHSNDYYSQEGLRNNVQCKDLVECLSYTLQKNFNLLIHWNKQPPESLNRIGLIIWNQLFVPTEHKDVNIGR